MKKLTITTAVLAALSANATHAATIGGTDVTYGGYVKLDAMWTDTSAGTIGGTSIGRDFYVPGTVPVGADKNSDAVFDMHARQSRFFFGTKTALDNGDSISTKIELDFMATPDGNERVSNSYTPRIRQAFVSYNNVMFGQAWSNFQNVGALPETLDFVGPAEGTVFVRQAQVRYTHGAFSFSAENPESTVTVNGGRVETDDQAMPDFTARYTYKADWGNLVVAGLMREVTYKQNGLELGENSYGISASGRVNFGKNNLKFMLTTGQGLGRYVGLNVANAAELVNERLEMIDSTSGFVAYQQHWNEQWRSTFLYSFFDADNYNGPFATAGDPTKSSTSYSANILYSPQKNLTFGLELKHAERETESGADGDLDRVQFSAKYAF